MTDPIKAKIQELCPDVMGLKFGCEVDYHGIYIAKTPDDDEFYFAPKETDVNGEAQVYCVNSINPKQILGSPITLAVVLRAIDKARGVGVHIAISTTGTFMEREVKEVTAIPFAKRFLSAGTGWNLEHDNYDQQSEECKQFIGSLLLTNEK